jgi:hypothetical protein
MNKKYTLIGYRIFFALLGLSAIVTEIAVLIERGRFVPANFFSFFTVESNILAVLILILSALALARGKQGRFIAMLRGGSTLNMIVVGIVFSLLLSGLDVELTAVPWDNTVLHYIMPVAVALDWLIDIPKVRISFKRALIWVTFPIAYAAYSLIRGHFVGWYPYPFLNPGINGYTSVIITSILLGLGGAALALALAWSTRWRSTVKK